MVPIRTDFNNIGSDDLIGELKDIARRKRRAADHLEAAIECYGERQSLADSTMQFRQEEVGQQE